MQILKFGGSSLANAQCFVQVASIITRKASGTSPVAIVVSAPDDITALLARLTTTTLDYNQKFRKLKTLKKRVQSIVHELKQQHTAFDFVTTEHSLQPCFDLLEKTIKGADLLQYYPEAAIARVLSCGEIISVILLEQLLQTCKLYPDRIEPHKFLITKNGLLNAVVDIEVTKQRFCSAYPLLAKVAIMPGFIGVNEHGQTTILGRNGSDYSAAILAICTQASHCEIWTDVNGIYNADPDRVPQAEPVPYFSYKEAMELSHFGAKVLHPKTIAPIAQHCIPCLIKNTFNPEGDGTLIASRPDTIHPLKEHAVKAISSLDDITMMTISGPGMKGHIGIAGRIFSTVSQAGVSLLLISQSSSEYAISFCIHTRDVQKTQAALDNNLSLELTTGCIEPVSITHDLAIVSLVGDNMRHKKGVAAKFFTALAQAQVNIVAIAQDASERSISAVIANKRCTQALKACHQNFFTTRKSIDTFIIGCGTVGGELLNQIARQQPTLIQQGFALNVYGISNSKGLYLASEGIDLSNWHDIFNSLSEKNVLSTLTLKTLSGFVKENNLINPVIVDCTCSDSIALQYANYLKAGFHVVTPNKKANTSDYTYYEAVKKAAHKTQKRFLFETTVGAGLPIIDTLQGLFRAGDQLVQFEGVLSGSLSYIFGKLEEGMTLSEATTQARANGYTEPDPREDLSGMDVARKVLIIAREAGMKLSLADIVMDSFLPESLLQLPSVYAFMQALPSFDKTFAKRVNAALEKGKVLRYVGRIHEGKCSVNIEACGSSHPLYPVKAGENALAIYTRYYQPLPFILRGYGAGSAVTAAGIFGDLLRTLSWESTQ